jgi:DNA (cytosine-5)-methyltransferase 1
MPKHSNKPNVLTAVSLFSGCGGLDLGVIGGFRYRGKEYEKNPIKVVLANDIDKAATRVYEANSHYFGDHRVVTGDVRMLADSHVGDYDLLLAGFPCQPFSNAGLRKGIQDSRGNLFEECERLLKLGVERGRPPKAFIFENVRGILSSKMSDGTSIPDEIVKRTKRLGYNTVYKLLRASNYGVPSRRYRVLIVGVREDLGEFSFDRLDDVVKSYKIASENYDSYDLLLGTVLSDIPEDAAHFNEYWAYSPGGQYMVDRIGKCFGNAEVLEDFRKRTPVEQLPEEVKIGRSWKNMDPAEMSPRFRKIYDNPKKYRAPNFYRRFALAEINGTIIASAQPENCGITHPFENRRFTLREAARIQSFPDEFVFPHSSISNAYKVIGNAVPPILGWVLAKGLLSHLNEI